MRLERFRMIRTGNIRKWALVIFSCFCLRGFLTTINLKESVEEDVKRLERIPPERAWKVYANRIDRQNHELSNNVTCSQYSVTEDPETSKFKKRPNPILKSLHLESACYHVAHYQRYDRPKLPPVSLLSTQGSGNTWLRWLIERLTGVCTTSIYGGEWELFRKGLKCEMGMPQNNRSIVQKCHYYHQCKTSKVLLLIRNPFDAMVADYHRMHTRANHTGVADSKVFFTAYWDRFVQKGRGFEWLDQIQLVLSQADNVLVVFYENLVSDLRRELRRVADFLDVFVTDERLGCTLRYSTGKFKRNRTSYSARFYTQAQAQVVTALMVDALSVLRLHDVTEIPKIYSEAFLMQSNTETK